ncbi:Hexaprenyldihydroxybenzoate methyltransferase, mitochondrial [Dimargaris verticillata]|uniref:Ubiquinone biosynthesis O-methyltransferase, mitochondrial n=1 Tax=Dimargaris verticillata TaxID=2761393 RepID=A0A9W8B6K3_9FUNG|nr:Hexaprenyldihydroxybenzoate methyltransferase, mitochondrial [Dimargaris verticillata]
MARFRPRLAQAPKCVRPGPLPWPQQVRWTLDHRSRVRWHSAAPPPKSSESVAADEIAKFSRMSSEWWAPQGPFQILHLMNPARVQFIRDSVARYGLAHPTAPSHAPLQNVSVLDVGCGGGLLCEALARLGAKITGVDASHENIQIAKIHANQDPRLTQAPLTYTHTTAEALRDQAQQFDLVTAMEVVEHVCNPRQFVATLLQLAKPNGLVVMSTISRTYLAYALTILVAEHLLRLTPPGTHDHAKYLQPQELQAMLEHQGTAQVLETRGLWYMPHQARWRLMESDMGPWGTQANYILVARKLPTTTQGS